MYQHCQNPFAIKQWRKSVDLSPKPCFLASKQHFPIHFLLATCNVCPLTIPEFFAQTWVSDYWQLIHCGHSSGEWHWNLTKIDTFTSQASRMTISKLASDVAENHWETKGMKHALQAERDYNLMTTQKLERLKVQNSYSLGWTVRHFAPACKTGQCRGLR